MKYDREKAIKALMIRLCPSDLGLGDGHSSTCQGDLSRCDSCIKPLLEQILAPSEEGTKRTINQSVADIATTG